MARPAATQPGTELAEFTAKAAVTGVLPGVVFGAANSYLGLRVGVTASASIPAAVMTVAVFHLLRLRGTILEANLSQTIAPGRRRRWRAAPSLPSRRCSCGAWRLRSARWRFSRFSARCWAWRR